MLRKIIFLALLSTPAFAQWQTVATSNQIVRVPVGMVLRYGSEVDNMWSAPKLYLLSNTFTVGPGQFPINPDPLAKSATFVIQAWQLPVQQIITVAGAPVTVTTPTPTPAVPGTSAYCPTGLATSATINLTVVPATGFIAAGSGMTCK